MKLIAAAVEAATQAKIAVLLLPGHRHGPRPAHAHAAGRRSARIATHCTEADIVDPALRRWPRGARHGDRRVPDDEPHDSTRQELAEQARIMVDAGAQCVYVVDSAGALVLTDAQRARRGGDRRDRRPRRRSASTATRTSPRHRELGRWPTRPARCRSTAPRARSAPAPATARPRCSRPTFERMGIRTGVDLWRCIDAAEDVVAPVHAARCRWMDRASIIQGYAGVYSSFLLHAERAAERYGVAGPRDPRSRSAGARSSAARRT